MQKTLQKSKEKALENLIRLWIMIFMECFT